MRYALALSNRAVCWRVLAWLNRRGTPPDVLLFDCEVERENRWRMPVFTADLSESETCRAILEESRLDWALAVQYRRRVKPHFLAAPRYGWLNFHPGLLPHQRGWPIRHHFHHTIQIRHVARDRKRLLAAVALPRLNHTKPIP